MEVGVPELQRLPPGETLRALSVSATRLDFDKYDVVSQGESPWVSWRLGGLDLASTIGADARAESNRRDTLLTAG
jgi:hypothetical protein